MYSKHAFRFIVLVIPHRFKKIGLHNLVVRRIFSDILLVLGLKKVEKHCSKQFANVYDSRFATARIVVRAVSVSLCVPVSPPD
jgi:hypothetical protein